MVGWRIHSCLFFFGRPGNEGGGKKRVARSGTPIEINPDERSPGGGEGWGVRSGVYWGREGERKSQS